MRLLWSKVERQPLSQSKPSVHMPRLRGARGNAFAGTKKGENMLLLNWIESELNTTIDTKKMLSESVCLIIAAFIAYAMFRWL